MSSRLSLFFPPRGYEPPSTLRDRLNLHLSLQCRRFPTLPAMLNARMSLGTQTVHSFPFPYCPLRTAPSGFLNAIPYGSHPPLIRISSAPAPRSLVVRNDVSILPHRVISRIRLYEAICFPGLLRCATMMRSKIRWCTVRSLT